MIDILNEKRVLVTGGCGFIGSALVEVLISRGALVTVVDNLVTGKKENLPSNFDHAFFHEVDVRDTIEMKSLLKDVQIVFHLACLGVRHSIHDPNENNEVNATATLNLLNICNQLDLERFVHVSTSEVYGTAMQIPMDENTPAFPHTIYGSSKLAGECHARAFHKTYGMPVVILRPFNSYGPNCHHEGDSGEVIPKFILRALADRPMIIFGDGYQTRDFTYVSDTAWAISMAGVTEEAVGKTINIGSGDEISINDLASLIKKVTSKPEAIIQHLEPRPGDILRLYSDSKKAKKILGFEPKISFETGLTKLINWYQTSTMSPDQLLASEIEKNWVLEK